MTRELLLTLLSSFFVIGASNHALAQDAAQDTAIQESLEVIPRTSDPDFVPTRKVDWNLEFASEFESENKDEALAVITGLGLDMSFNLSQNLVLKVDPIARFYSARSQSRFDSDNFEDRVTLREGYLKYFPSRYFSASVGTHSKKYVDQSQLISGYRSFPGVKVQVTPATEKQNPILTFEEAIPTSYTYNALREDKETLPGLRIMDATLISEWNKGLTTRFQIGRLAWRNLPTKVAFASATLGNNYTGELAPGTMFQYGFETDYAQVGATYCEACRFGFFASYKRARNALAPSEAADAQMLGAGVSFRTFKTFTRASLSQFFAERDVTPGQYASSSLGNNNRQGVSANLDVEIPSLALKIKSQLIQARPINPDPYQFDMTSFYLGVETDGHFL